MNSEFDLSYYNCTSGNCTNKDCCSIATCANNDGYNRSFSATGFPLDLCPIPPFTDTHT